MAGDRFPDDAMPAPQRVAWLMHGSSDAAMLTDPHGRIEHVNPAFEALTGWSREEMLGRTPAVLKSGLQPPEVYQQLWRTLQFGHEFRGVLVNRRRNGEHDHEEKSIRPLADRTGRVTHLLSLGRDVSDRIAAMAQLRHTATHDALTGLPNRVLFLERLEAAIARVRQGGAGFAVVRVDVDAFKHINDVHGHAAGDAVLQAFAQRMQLSVRRADTVARLGRDEFALLLEGTDDARQTASLLESIARELSEPVPHGSVVLVRPGALGQDLREQGEWLGPDGEASQRHVCDAVVPSDAVVWVADCHPLVASGAQCQSTSSIVSLPPVRKVDSAGSSRTSLARPTPGQYHSVVTSAMSFQPTTGSANRRSAAVPLTRRQSSKRPARTSSVSPSASIT